MVTRRLALLLAGLFWTVGAAGQALAPPRCEYGKPHPNAPNEMAQFGFLIGDYKIHLHAWRGDEWSPPQPDVTARWNGWYGLGGMAIYDEWFNPDPAIDPDAGRGVNVRMYDPDERIWKMMWISTPGRIVQDLRAEVRDGMLTMWQVYPDRPDFKAIFNVRDEDHWERISFTHDENGNWVRQYKLAATRIPCAN